MLNFWFGDDPDQPLAMEERWFKRDDAFDEEVRRRFGGFVARAGAGEFEQWGGHAESALALIIMLDQFPRNLYRDSRLAFTHDGAALTLCLAGLQRGYDARLAHMRRSFFYMPLMHSEFLDHQRLSVEKFAELALAAPAGMGDAMENNHRFALAHLQLIERFGRFPHRNQVLHRSNTPEESTYLESPDAGF